MGIEIDTLLLEILVAQDMETVGLNHLSVNDINKYWETLLD